MSNIVDEALKKSWDLVNGDHLELNNRVSKERKGMGKTETVEINAKRMSGTKHKGTDDKMGAFPYLSGLVIKPLKHTGISAELKPD